MEKEQIIKALECFHNRILNSKLAEKVTEQEMMAIIDALALIKELTIELDAMRGAANSYKMHNERLTEENERLRKHNAVLIEDNHILSSECIPMTKADTVREFAERLKKECLVDSGYEVLQIGTIDHIAEEMLGKECTDCKHFVGCEPSTLGGCDLYEEEEKE